MSTISILEALSADVEGRFRGFRDPAHGWEHVTRVYQLALHIARAEGADPLITGAAALLHDIGRLVHKKGVHHAQLSLEESRVLLARYPFTAGQVEAILHAIEAHSFSQGVEARTLEARVLRDADRLDALGAIGILRWAITGTLKGKAETRNYHPDDPFGERRALDDRLYRLDHFFTKLLKLEEGIATETGRAMARRRTEYMRGYLQEFRAELEELL